MLRVDVVHQKPKQRKACEVFHRISCHEKNTKDLLNKASHPFEKSFLKGAAAAAFHQCNFVCCIN